MTASTPSRFIASNNAPSTISGLSTIRTTTVNPIVFAAAEVSRTKDWVCGSATPRNAMVRISGLISRTSSRRLPARSGEASDSPRQIRPRARQAWNEARRQGIGDNHHDRNRLCGLLGKQGRGSDPCDQDVDRFLDECTKRRLRTLPIAVGEPGFKADISALDIAELGQALAQEFHLIACRWRLPAHEAEFCDFRLLRISCQRPHRRRPANKTDKFPPPHRRPQPRRLEL